MDIGTGIFFGLVFLGLVWLYVATRDRWRWKRIIIWFSVLVSLPIAGGGGWLWFDNYRESKPRFEGVFWDLRPGMGLDELAFRKGEPKEKNENYWLYAGDGADVAHVVSLRNGKVRAIEAIAREGKAYALPTLQGISRFSSQEEIENKFGAPDAISIAKGGARRMLSFLRYGLVFVLEKNQVVALGVLDPSEGALRYREEAPGSTK